MQPDWRHVLPAILALGAATPAVAFNCDKAATPAEKAICVNPAARAADLAMSQAFAALIERESASQKASAVAEQVEWISERDGACAPSQGAKLSACLAAQSERRRAFLAGEPEAGPGAPGRLEPVLRYAKGGKGKAEITLELLKYPSPATPAERAFNAAVERLVGDLPEPAKDDGDSAAFEHGRRMRLVFASPKLISAHLDGDDYLGGAHPNSYSGDVNIDVEAGREAKFADLLDAPGAKKVFAFCLKSVEAQKKARLDGDATLTPDDLKQLVKDVAEQTGRIEIWSFAAQKATVTYDPYAVGSYAEGGYDCEIPYATLKPLVRPGFPLP